MTPEEMINAFREAEQAGFVTDVEDYAECISMEEDNACARCPASGACKQLTEETSYNKFIENFDRLIRPLLEETDND
jgi:adenine-specific DNA glycosylase